MVCNHCNGVGRTHERIMSVNHISVTIAIGRSSKGNFLGIDTFDEGVCICEIGIGMASPEIGTGMAVLGG